MMDSGACSKEKKSKIFFEIQLQRAEKIISWDIDEADWVDIGTPEKLKWVRKNIHLFA